MFTSLTMAALLIGAAPQEAQVTGKVQVREAAAPVWKATLGKSAPGFELKDTDGKAWDLRSLRGKNVVLEWFNPECPVVVAAHEGGPLETLGNRASNRDDTVWLAINSGAEGNQGFGTEKNKAAMQKWSLSYPVLADASGWVGRAYGAKTTPQMFVINAEGALVFAGHHDHVSAALEDVWAARDVATPTSKSRGCSVKYASKAAMGTVTPDFTLTDAVSGKPVTLSDYAGKVVVMEWFNPECPVVKEAHGRGCLNSAAANWTEESPDVVWLAVNSGAPGKQGHGAEKNKAAAQSWKLNHPVLMDEEGKVGRAYGAATTPHMFIMDRRGRLAYVGAHQDADSGESFVDAALTSILAGEKVGQATTRNYGCSVKYGS